MSEFIGDRVTRILRESGFESEAAIVDDCLKALKSNCASERRAGAVEIQRLSNIRAYGDLNVQGIGGWEWNSMLDKLRKYAERKIE